MLRFVFASHERMAEGLKRSIEFLTSTEECVYEISAYITPGDDLKTRIRDLFNNFNKDDTVVIMTDLMSGSVNQKFYPYLNDKVHLLTGVNMPLAMTMVLTPEACITKNGILQTIEEARKSIIYVNEWKADSDEDDE